MINIFLFLVFFIFSINAKADNNLNIVSKKIICNKNNSGDIMKFKFSSDNIVKFEEYTGKEKINNHTFKYSLKNKKIIVYNPNVLPIRQETHIDLDAMKMKTGLFTNRYPLINKGTCKKVDW